MPDIQLSVRFSVIAYDESGYGENCSREFTDGNEAVAYAQSLAPRFGARVWRIVTMEDVRTLIWPKDPA